MREVSVARTIDATERELRAWLEPARIVEAEGSFDVAAVEPADERDVDGDVNVTGEADTDSTIVVASGPGMQLPLRFEDRGGTIYYTQEGERGPFDHMETWIELEPTTDGRRTELRIRSSVSLAAPLPFGDRIAAWKRKGELNRALEAAEEAFS
ncbi:polyketide cyclase [Halobiforma lacisalsi AJ5]|uniref:Polyketide cyclase n=1 Tax=Natronobacterium lacisalsi AJ5 TaxID=358396 RepID=M0LZ86_NATLA|nr:hypothetical protein [Halobiforma lacisalsi]APW97821.1 polyketide cyclase [Halobiforma lacisalsi AJ5]EMA37430.1 hypothetical protein C445_01036 [Halobiforma lacisalsi AJ5]